MPVKKVDGKYQYGTEGKAYKTYAKAARQGAAIKASQRQRLHCQTSPNAKDCKSPKAKRTAGVSHSGREGGGAHRKQIWSGAGRTGDLVSYAHGKQTGTEEQDAEKAAITRKIRDHNEAQKKKRG